MRNVRLTLATSLLAMSLAAIAQAQQRDQPAAMPAIATDTDDGETAVDTGADQEMAESPRSGFGQVMSVLTSLLHDAAQQEASGRSDGFALDNPAIEISVTPVEGRTSLLQAPPERNAARARRGGRERLAGGTPR